MSKLQRFYVVLNSNAAPFCSDTSEEYIVAKDAMEALNICVDEYSHPCGLFSAGVYASHEDRLSGEQPIVRYLSQRARKANK